MEREEAFIERILDARSRGAEARQREEEAIAEAAAAMGEALGTMKAFAAMDSSAFPVRHEAVDSLDDSSEIPDFGSIVTAIMDRAAAGCTRVYAQTRTRDGEEFMTVSLHPARSGLCWTVEVASRAYDGEDWNARREYRTAEKALAAVRTRVLGHAVRTASHGEMDSLPVLPEGDEAAAAAARSQMEQAVEAGREAEFRKRRRAEEIARSANAIANVWERAAGKLGFLKRLGYGVGMVVNGLGIVAGRTGSGISVRIVSGESWAGITAEALHDDPGTAVLSVVDSAGRREAKGHVAVADSDLLASEMERAVLAEIETAESAYLPDFQPAPVAGPAMQ